METAVDPGFAKVGRGERVEREPTTKVWGRFKAPFHEAESFLSIFIQKEGQKLMI